ncbi:hypothetical protein DFJ73DRAFT_849201 [Zopfochytrium polystomum]|nr:hypothetical protein DFJ73DRAFT_849201 [Zopfochytrium polystomum]
MLMAIRIHLNSMGQLGVLFYILLRFALFLSSLSPSFCSSELGDAGCNGSVRLEQLCHRNYIHDFEIYILSHINLKVGKERM